MLRSVEEVAIQLQVSKTSIYNKLKLKEFKTHIVQKHGKSMVDDDLFNLIKESLKLNDSFKLEGHDNAANDEISIDEDGLIKLNQKLNEKFIDSLLEQLKEKDKQIEELISLNKNNQILLKQEQDKKTILLEQHFEEFDKKLLDIKLKMEDKKKRAFFKR